MIRGIDTLQRSFNILTEKQKTLANNAANTTTPGYKTQQLVQSTTESRAIHNYMAGPRLNQRTETDEWIFGNQLDAAYRQFGEGALEETNMETDLAMHGEGFFTVQSEAGEVFYTRNGNFTVNDAGQLTTQEGLVVQGIAVGGGSVPITVSGGTDPRFAIDGNGFVHIPGQPQQYLYVTQFEDPNTLESVGDTLFQGAGGTPAAGGFTISQGYVEQSNVNMTDMMTNMLQISREFEANQRTLRTTDEMLRRTTNEVGSV